jgi:hypothetical protein
LVLGGLRQAASATKEWVVTRQVQSHHTNTEMSRSAPPQVDAGTAIGFKVKVSCPSGCDLRGNTVRVVDQDRTVAKEVALTSFEEGKNETNGFTVEGPIEPGQCTWSVVFPAQDVGGVLHDESSTPVLFSVRPHATIMTVWDIPSPVAVNDKFKIKVGVKCSVGCNLTDNKIAVYGQRRKKVAVGTLGGVPWPGTSALYWTELGLEAPGAEGHYRWRAKFAQPGLDLPHQEASHDFAFTAAPAPQHTVTVQVIAQDTKTPISNAQVLLRPQGGYPYRAFTDDSGLATLRVPEGQYQLHVSKTFRRPQRRSLEVRENAAIKLELWERWKEWWE